MARLKTFGIYFILFVSLYVFVSIMSNGYISATYKEIENYKIVSTSPKIVITDARSTYMNGYIYGKITNTTGKTIDNQSIQVDFYSKRDVVLGTEFVNVNNLKPNETREFSLAYRYQDIASFHMGMADKMDAQPKEERIFDQNSGLAVVGATIILMYFLL